MKLGQKERRIKKIDRKKKFSGCQSTQQMKIVEFFLQIQK